MAGLTTVRRCPYCAEEIQLGDCPIVATNFDDFEFNGGGKRKLSDFKLPSGTRPKAMLETGWPIVAPPPREARSAVSLAVAAAAGKPTLSPVFSVAAREDLPTRACPYCQLPLPHSIDDRPAIVIGVVGVNRVGKTHLLASSVAQATRRRGLERIGSKDCSLDESTAERFRTNYYEPLFRQSRVLDKTQEKSGVRFHPLICNLMLPRHGKLRKLSVILHDVAGEFMANPKRRATEAPYLRGAKGMIFVVDPREIDSLRPGIPDWILDEKEDKIAFDQGALLSACLRPDGIVDRGELIPVAIAVAKADLLSKAAGRPLPFLAAAPPREDPKSFVKRVKATSKQVAEFLEEQEAFDILDPAETYGQQIDGVPRSGDGRVTFHAFSALGMAPGSDKTLPGRVQPLNCIDPLATVLAQIE
jgi:hypothetical protein